MESDKENFCDSRLDRGWIIANHKLVSFHAAFLTSLISISHDVASRMDVIRQMFLSWEVVVSGVMWYVAWHVNIAIHEMGHYLAAVKTNNLRPELLDKAQKKMKSGMLERWLWYIWMFIRIPWGKFEGVTRENGSYFPAVKAQNLAVSAAGPRASKNLFWVMFPLGFVIVVFGMTPVISLSAGVTEYLVYGGRFLFTIGVVAGLDFLLADPGKYRAFRERQKEAGSKASEVRAEVAGRGGSNYKWIPASPSALKHKLEMHRLQEIRLPNGTEIYAPWEFRNSIMGGRHTEEVGGNLSFQELMFLPLNAQDYIEAQRITSALQSRVIQIIQDSEGLNFVGIGLEGGVVASYAKQKGELLPEERALKVAVQAIEECGFVPDRDVCLALDSAASELSIAYRENTGKSEAVGHYLFWRAEEPKVMTTEELVELYKRWVREYPIISLEDPFAEDDYEGWKHLMSELGNEVLIIGDDLVTTKDTTIVKCADEGLINTALIKANQIGTMSETLLATRAAREKGLELVVSHRSKSPNEVMEADIAFAVGALGLKCGGGSNTERLIKYGRIVELINLARKGVTVRRNVESDLEIVDISAHEEPTNAGIPSVGVMIRLENGMKFTAATPLGTSAGTDEAIHLVDSMIEKSPVVERYPEFFDFKKSTQTYKFKSFLATEAIGAKNDDELSSLWLRARRYGGKGCLNAVENVEKRIAPEFLGKKLSEIGQLEDVDTRLLALELKLAGERGKIPEGATQEEKISIMQRKANLGMNAVLSMSLAMGRLIAAREGVEPPYVFMDVEKRLDRDTLYGQEKINVMKPERKDSLIENQL